MTLQTFCPVCGATLAFGAQFCGNRGTRLAPAGTIAPGPAASAAGVEYAGFWMRFVAAIVDALILLIPYVPIELWVDGTGSQLLLRVLIGAVYNVGFWVANDGATPGKMVMGMKIVMVNGEPIGVGPAFLRWIGYYISFLTLGIGYLMIAFTPQKRGLQDYIAGTVVIKTR